MKTLIYKSIKSISKDIINFLLLLFIVIFFPAYIKVMAREQYRKDHKNLKNLENYDIAYTKYSDWDILANLSIFTISLAVFLFILINLAISPSYIGIMVFFTLLEAFHIMSLVVSVVHKRTLELYYKNIKQIIPSVSLKQDIKNINIEKDEITTMIDHIWEITKNKQGI